MVSDFYAIFLWWLVFFVIGLTSFPLTARIFANFIDRGYLFAKIVGLLLVSYVLFLFAHAKLLFIDQPTLLVLFAALAGVNLLIEVRSQDKPTLAFLRQGWKLLVFEELLFFFCLWFWSTVRGFAPEIHGLEKFMDFGFVNSILAGKTLPPLDMWLTAAPDFSGHFINYYYFGHFVSALLTRISGIDSVLTYNLMIATLFAFCLGLSFSLGFNLFYLVQKQAGNVKKAFLVGIVTAYLVTLTGNLHTIYLFTTGYPNDEPKPFWQILAPFNPNAYWYPNATRFIPFTIHEFPIYSFVVSDLHGHVLDIPFVLLTLALLLTIISAPLKPQKWEMRSGKWDVGSGNIEVGNQKNLKGGKTNSNPTSHFSIKLPTSHFSFLISFVDFKLLFLGLLLAVMFMTNAWDGIIYLVLSGLVLLYRNYHTPNTNLHPLLVTLAQGAVVTFLFIVFALPFHANFKPFVHGIGVVGGWEIADSLGRIQSQEVRQPPDYQAPVVKPEVITVGPFLLEKDKNVRSPLWMLIVLWGFFYYSVIGFLVFVIFPGMKNLNQNLKSQNPIDVFMLLLIILSTILLIFPEFFYAKDIYPAHYRANTMFKLGYQAFMMLQIASAYIFFRILCLGFSKNRKLSRMQSMFGELPKVLWIFGFAFLFYLVCVYPYFAITSYYGNLKYYKGLDGLRWLALQYPDDYQAIIWLRARTESCKVKTNCDPQPVILEAVGESYTDYARVSANTGLPTIVGWPVHEWLWRGSDKEPNRRSPLVEAIYTSNDVNYVKSLLDKYHVALIFVGTLERQKYPTLTEEIFKQLGEVIFERGDTRIYSFRSFKGK